MKTAVSIPDELFTAADRLAAGLRMSRSELSATALRAYIAKQQHDDITEQLNAIYDTEASTLDPELALLQAHAISREI